MAHENVCAEATDVKRALFDICALSCECACASRACVCITREARCSTPMRVTLRICVR
ncbi:hypothetical protein [Fannyhessea vaginae]|uniref:hypothetical protein n=1 Tax=Fannyhessea vaginae TaxID=82135 RepID=UPI00288AE4E9|nr:hypothetical protein [Fannyhessea vaginae]